ncbi:MAG: nucleoside deaminase [Rhodospirillales bacterium]|nr:nucleoside deaminase [Rhodospirillales bacterium]
MSSKDSQWMRIALDEARGAYDRGEVPVGAVLISASGDELARAGNRIEELNDPTAHAEIMAIREAANIAGSPRLVGTTLYVTLEPCAMCAQAISLARVNRLVFAAYDPKGGGVEHGARVFSHKTCHHIPEVVGGLMETEASEMLRDFFKERRQ